MINYLIEVTFCWLLFYGLYVSFLKKETFFSINRFYLLGTFLGGLIIPLLEIAPESGLAQQVQQTILLDEVGVTGNGLENAAMINEVNPAFDWSHVLFLVYGLVFLFMAFRMLKGLFQIYQLKKQGTPFPETNYTRIETIKPHAPFSFFHYLFLSKENGLSTTEQHQVIAHELAHIKGRHSFDVLLMELITIFLWFHPLIFLYKRSIKENHEYLADNAVLAFSSKKQYGRLLVEQAIPGLRLANNFNHSLLKKRIKMMSSLKSKNINLIKYSSCIPLILFAFILFSCSKETVEKNKWEGPDKMSVQTMPDDEFNPVSGSAKVDRAYKERQLEAFSSLAKHLESKGGASSESAKRMSSKAEAYQKALEDGPMKDKDGTFTLVEEMARFPGCESGTMTKKERKTCSESEMLEFIYEHLTYPEEARTNGIQGLIFAEFDIDTQGNILNPQISKGIGGGCDEEALRVINKMPKWIPAKQEGEVVKVKFTLPIRFRLN